LIANAFITNNLSSDQSIEDETESTPALPIRLVMMNTEFRSTVRVRPPSSSGSEAAELSTTTDLVSSRDATQHGPPSSSSAEVSGFGTSDSVPHLNFTPIHRYVKEIKVDGAPYDSDIGVVRWSMSTEVSTWSNPDDPGEHHSQRILPVESLAPDSDLIEIAVLDAEAQAIEKLISGRWDALVKKMITEFLARGVRDYSQTSIRLVKDLQGSSEAGKSEALGVYMSRKTKTREHGLMLKDGCSIWVAGELYVFFGGLLSYKPLGESDVRRSLEFTMSLLDSNIDDATRAALTAERNLKDLEEILQQCDERPK
jgi:hypothetical protein